VNAIRAEQLTDFRLLEKENAIRIIPPIVLRLEYAVELIKDDESVEITAKSIRLRKRYLEGPEHKRAS
jgi:GTP-binding protein